MTFLEDILARATVASNRTLLIEPHSTGWVCVNGAQLLELVSQARAFLRSLRLQKGDRVALLGANSIEWVAIDLAIIAEGLIVVPLYARQAPAELVSMMRDCSPFLICCGNVELRDGIMHNWPEAPRAVLFEAVFAGPATEL